VLFLPCPSIRFLQDPPLTSTQKIAEGVPLSSQLHYWSQEKHIVVEFVIVVDISSENRYRHTFLNKTQTLNKLRKHEKWGPPADKGRDSPCLLGPKETWCEADRRHHW
jgi:hypothetical protein